MAGEKFSLNFISDGFGKQPIDEPFGYNALSWDFQQKEKGYGRDILFNGGEMQLQFTGYRNHFLNKLLYYNHHFGYESKVELEIVFPSGLITTLDLDFTTAECDDYLYFKCKLIQQSDILVVKRKADTKVDLFSTKDIYGNPIDPIPVSKVLLKPKSILQVSKIQQSDFNNIYMETKDNNYWLGNPCQIIVQSDINDTLTALLPYDQHPVPNPYYVIEAQEKIENLTITIPKGLYIKLGLGFKNDGKGHLNFKLSYAYGANDQQNRTNLISLTKHINQPTEQYENTFTNDFVFTVPMLQKGDKVWVYFEWDLANNSSLWKSKVHCTTTIKNMELDITGMTSTISSVATGIRLIDAIKQVVKSISGKATTAPIFDVGSDYYNTFLFNGNLLRGITTDNPDISDPTQINVVFSLSLNDIANSITECNSDYEVNDTVFFGTEKDYYTAIECGFFDTTQFKDFSKTFNPRMCINQFSLKYKNFQALKENELPQTADTVHGEIILSLYNKNTENTKDVSVNWVRDAFLFEEARNKGLTLTDTTAYQNDDTVFALDTKSQISDTAYNQTTELSHRYDASTKILYLKSVTDNFILMGIEVGTYFYIYSPDNNSGAYTVSAVTNNTLNLIAKPSGNAYPNTNNDGIRTTLYQYIILASSVPFSNYTTEGIINAAGINDPNSYSNLRYSSKRDIVTWYSNYLATCNQYWEEQPLKVTWYKNNRNFTCSYNGIDTNEGADYLPTDKILSPNLYQNVIFANIGLDDFFTLINNLRTNRGFVRTIDKNTNVIKLYPVKMSYKLLEKELTLTTAEEKFEPSQMTLSTANTEIVINNETAVHQLDYEITDNKLYLFDTHRQLLYNGVYWDKVAINGEYAKDFAEFEDLMELVKSKNN